MAQIEKHSALSVDTLTPHKHNAKIHTDAQIEAIAESIKQFGFVQPIVTDENKIILAGHGRLEAAKRLQMAEVPVWVVRGLTEDEKTAFMLADNKLNLLTGFDEDALLAAIKTIEDKTILETLDIDFSTELPNFDMSTNDMVPPPEATEDNFEVPKEDEVEVLIKTGDLIEMGQHRLICGDSTDPEVVKEVKNGQTVTLMCTDPPYGVEYDPSWRSNNKDKQGIVHNDDKTDWTETYKNVDAQIAYVWHSGKFTHLFAQNLEDAGFQIISQIIWNKERFAMPRGDYHWKHEPCWYAVKEKKTHNWQGSRKECTVWDISAREDKGHGHSTQKPVECMARPITNNTSLGQVVCDPFLGSGTTLVAAEKLGRIFVGCELFPLYAQIALCRWIKLRKAEMKDVPVKINGEAISEEWLEKFTI